MEIYYSILKLECVIVVMASLQKATCTYVLLKNDSYIWKSLELCKLALFNRPQGKTEIEEKYTNFVRTIEKKIKVKTKLPQYFHLYKANNQDNYTIPVAS